MNLEKLEEAKKRQQKNIIESESRIRELNKKIEAAKKKETEQERAMQYLRMQAVATAYGTTIDELISYIGSDAQISFYRAHH